VVGSVVTAVVPFVHDPESSVLVQCIAITNGLCIHHIEGCWKWFSSAHRYASHLTNTLFISHQRSCGETENTIFWMLSFRESAVRLLLCSLTFKMSHKITQVQIRWMRRLHSPAYYYCQKQCKHCRELFVMQVVVLDCWWHEMFSCNWTCVQMMVSTHVLHDVNLGSQATHWAQ
jgi:hypothetical protein